MKDFNFFSIYNKERQRGQKRTILLSFLLTLSLFVFFCVFTIYYSFELKIRALRYEISSNVMFLDSTDTIERLNQYAELNDQLNDLNSYNTKSQQLAEHIVCNSVIKTGLLINIAQNIPKDTEIETLSISLGEISIVGKSGSDISIAQFQHNLSGLDFIGDVFVGVIQKLDNNTYAFAMTAKVKDVASDVWDE